MPEAGQLCLRIMGKMAAGQGEGGRVAREALYDQVPCEQGPEGREGASSIDLRRASTSARVS